MNHVMGNGAETVSTRNKLSAAQSVISTFLLVIISRPLVPGKHVAFLLDLIVRNFHRKFATKAKRSVAD